MRLWQRDLSAASECLQVAAALPARLLSGSFLVPSKKKCSVTRKQIISSFKQDLVLVFPGTVKLA